MKDEWEIMKAASIFSLFPIRKLSVMPSFMCHGGFPASTCSICPSLQALCYHFKPPYSFGNQDIIRGVCLYLVNLLEKGSCRNPGIEMLQVAYIFIVYSGCHTHMPMWNVLWIPSIFDHCTWFCTHLATAARADEMRRISFSMASRSQYTLAYCGSFGIALLNVVDAMVNPRQSMTSQRSRVVADPESLVSNSVGKMMSRLLYTSERKHCRLIRLDDSNLLFSFSVSTKRMMRPSNVEHTSQSRRIEKQAMKT